VELNLLQKDYFNENMELDDESSCNEPPPLISKRPMSRLHIAIDNQTPRQIDSGDSVRFQRYKTFPVFGRNKLGRRWQPSVPLA